MDYQIVLTVLRHVSPFPTRGVGRNFSRGVVLSAIFQKGSFCTDLFCNTLYRKCIKLAPLRLI